MAAVDRRQRRKAEPKRAAPPDAPAHRRRTRLLLLVGGLLAAVAVAWFAGAPARVALAFARDALWDRDSDRAGRWVAFARRFDATNPEAELLAARIDRREQRFDAAADHLRVARRFGADRAAIRDEELMMLAQSGRLDGIETELNRRMAEAPPADRRELCEAYANGLARLARFDHCVRLLEAWRSDFPDDAQPDYRLGRIYEHLRRKPEAEQHYRSALEKDPRCYPAAFSLARLLLDRKEVDEALALYRRCAELPHAAAAKAGMAACLKALGDVDGARRLFREAATASEADRAASYAAVGEPAERLVAAAELGKLESEQGNFEEAERWLRTAVESNPRDSVARYAWAVALRGLGRTEDAERQFGLVRAARQALDEAGKLHDHVDRHPEDVEARYRLGTIILEHDSERMGLYWLGTVLDLDPRHAATHRALADYYAAAAAAGDGSPDARALAEFHRAQADRSAADGPPQAASPPAR